MGDAIEHAERILEEHRRRHMHDAQDDNDEIKHAQRTIEEESRRRLHQAPTNEPSK